MNTSYKNCNGFTLVELMITVAISGIIITAIYSAYISQQRTYLAQEQVAEMQQNIRAAIDMMEREIRMAGYDVNGDAGAGIAEASVGRFGFTQDITDSSGAALEGDGRLDGPNEAITFGFSIADDADQDGIADAGAAPLGRLDPNFTGGNFEPIAENIQALVFYYTLKNGTMTTTPATLADIRSVQVSILARTGRPDQNFTNNMTYTPASGTPWDLNGAAAGNAANDNFRRRLFVTTIKCRNIGL